MKRSCFPGTHVTAALLFLGSVASAVTFSPKLTLPPVQYGAQAWAIPDSSGTYAGKSILALSGQTPGGTLKTYIVWIESQSGVPGVAKIDSSSIPGIVFGQADWADYNRDGLLDLAISGRTVSATDTLAQDITMVYRQYSDGSFRPEAAFPSGYGMDSTIVRWVDYDNDGDMDLFVSGRKRILSLNPSTGKKEVTGESRLHVFRNDSPTPQTVIFVRDTGVRSRVDQIIPVHDGDADWADIDGNGTPDLAITGKSATFLQGNRVATEIVTEVYLNNPAGVFTRNVLTSLPPRYGGGIAWGDMNEDGLLDIALSGYAKPADGGALTLEVWLHLGEGSFRKQAIQLDQRDAVAGRLAWMDVDNDGRFDLIAMGDSSATVSGIRLYRNNSDLTLSRMSASLPALGDGAFSLGHLDADGTVDLIASGRLTPAGASQTTAWSLSGVPANALPTTPSLSPRDNRPLVAADRVYFTWGQSSDDANGKTVSYEILLLQGVGNETRVLTAPAAFGPAPHGRKLTYTLLRSLPPGSAMPLYVRARDAAGNTSPWSAPITVYVQDFVNSLETIVPLRSTAASWVDINGDGAPDLVVNGFDQGSNETNRLYVNQAGTLVPNTAYDLPGVYLGSQAWADVNADGYPDVMLTGSESEQVRITSIFLNRALQSVGLFDANAMTSDKLTGSRAAFGDIDNDGDVDFVVTGVSGAALKTLVGENTGVITAQGVVFNVRALDLTLVDTPAKGLKDGCISLVDFDQDGNLDLTIQGNTDNGTPAADDDFWAGYLFTFRNTGGMNFSMVNTPAPAGTATIPAGSALLDQLGDGEHVWADVDNDGDPDLICVGFSRTTAEFVLDNVYWDASALRIYENTGGGNLVMKQAFPGLWKASLAVGDVDNDGKVDILVSGYNDHVVDTGGNHLETPTLRLYVNDGTGRFAEKSVALFSDYGVALGAVRFADVDGDGDLDAIAAGEGVTADGKAVPKSTLFANTNAYFVANRRPNAPTGLAATVGTADSVRLSWNEAIDADPGTNKTPFHTYALRAGTFPGRGNIRSGAEPVGRGTIGYMTHATIRGLADGVYYWSVQAVDNGLARSEWAPEQSFVIDTKPPRVARLRGDTLSVGLDRVINVAIDFDDALTGVDTLSTIDVTLSLVGQPSVQVTKLRWDPGDVWFGQASIPTGSFLFEPVRVRVRNVRDIRGNVLADTTFATRLVFTAAQRIAREEGGTITNSAGTISLYVPPRSFDREVGISLAQPDSASLPAGPGPGLSLAVEFTPDVAVGTLAVPAVLTMKYGASPRVARGAVVASNLHIFRLDGSTWTYIGGLADDATKTISVPVNHLGTYALFEASGNVTDATLGDLACTPRVFSPGTTQGYSDKTVIAFTVSTADAGNSATISIFNTAGRLVREMAPSIVAGANSIAWNGTDDGGSIAPSGMYIVAVKVGGVEKRQTVVILNKYARP